MSTSELILSNLVKDEEVLKLAFVNLREATAEIKRLDKLFNEPYEKQEKALDIIFAEIENRNVCFC